MLRQTLSLLIAQWVFIFELPGRSLLGHLHLSKRHQSEVSHLRGRYTRLDINRNMLVSLSLIHSTRSIIALSYQYPFASMSTNEISNLMVRFCIIYLLGLKLCKPNIRPIQNERFTNPNIGIQLVIFTTHPHGNHNVCTWVIGLGNSLFHFCWNERKLRSARASSASEWLHFALSFLAIKKLLA